MWNFWIFEEWTYLFLFLVSHQVSYLISMLICYSDFCCLYHLPVDLVRNYIRHLNVGLWKAHSTYLTDAGYTLNLLNGYEEQGRLAFPVRTVEQDKPTLPCKEFHYCWVDQSWGISCIYFRLHAALQSQLVNLTGSQAGMASVRMICFFSCLSLRSPFWAWASISLALLIKAFCAICCLHWLLVFKWDSGIPKLFTESAMNSQPKSLIRSHQN